NGPQTIGQLSASCCRFDFETAPERTRFISMKVVPECQHPLVRHSGELSGDPQWKSRFGAISRLELRLANSPRSSKPRACGNLLASNNQLVRISLPAAITSSHSQERVGMAKYSARGAKPCQP